MAREQIIVVMLSIYFSVSQSAVIPASDDPDPQEYLQKFGYIAKPDDGEGKANRRLPSLSDALRKFQRRWGLAETGVLDATTLELMRAPRCGDVDEHPGIERTHAQTSGRYRLYGWKLSKRYITYKINRPTEQISLDVVNRQLDRAFNEWMQYINLEAEPTSSLPDIKIGFYKFAHGDKEPFDGRGDTLAHALFPQYGGGIHMDDSETWTLNTYRGTNMYQVFLHELGHSLGLAHSGNSEAIMAPFYRGYIPNAALTPDDIAGARALYGSKPTTTTAITTTSTASVTEPETTPVPPIYCNATKIDAVTRLTADGDPVYFYGDEYCAQGGTPAKIADGFPGLPNDIDAALYWPATTLTPEATFFFKGADFWKWEGGRLADDDSYPKKIRTQFRGIPSRLGAAFRYYYSPWAFFFRSGSIFMYSASGFFIPTQRMVGKFGFPKPFSPEFPRLVDAAYQKGRSRVITIFSGSNMYKFNVRSMALLEQSPISSLNITFSCK